MKVNYHQDLLPNARYHLFSRAVGEEKLFLSDENYRYFLRRLSDHTATIVDIYCYSLQPNHFHLLVKMKTAEVVVAEFERVKKRPFESLTDNLSDFLMERFSNWLNGYTKAFNKMNNRKGALFMDYLKRSKVLNDQTFGTMIFYIHKNAVHHGLRKAIGEWAHDSYNSILSKKPTALMREDVLNFFGDEDGFIDFHKQKIILKGMDLLDV